MYSTKFCPNCKSAKAFLDKRGSTFREVILENQEQIDELIAKTKSMTVPQIKIKDEWVIGYNPRTLLEALQRNGL